MNLLKQLRLNKKMYQKDVAEYLGVDRTTYVKYENGTSEPDIATIKKLATLFNVSIDYLLTGKEYFPGDNFFRTLLSDNGIIALKLYLKHHIDESRFKILNEYFDLSYSDVKTFIDLGVEYGGKFLDVLDKVLIALDLNIYDVFKECYRAENNEQLTANERTVIQAYRKRTDMQAAINTLLGIAPPSPTQKAVEDAISEQFSEAVKTSANNV